MTVAESLGGISLATTGPRPNHGIFSDSDSHSDETFSADLYGNRCGNKRHLGNLKIVARGPEMDMLGHGCVLAYSDR